MSLELSYQLGRFFFPIPLLGLLFPNPIHALLWLPNLLFRLFGRRGFYDYTYIRIPGPDMRWDGLQPDSYEVFVSNRVTWKKALMRGAPEMVEQE